MCRIKIIKICVIFVLFLTNLHGNSLSEKEFKDRIFSFIEKGEISEPQINLIWVKGDSPDSESKPTYELLQKLIKKKVGKIEFIEIAPEILKGIDTEVFEVEGENYTSNMKPYSFVKFHYKNIAEGEVYASQTLLGIKDNKKLYIMGLRKIEK
tara:strand:+ start:2068 stop:2526 length:459 start_codon:yes stop_codon:yes gene_type:complete